MKTTISFIFSLILLHAANSQDKIITIKQDTIFCKIILISQKNIKFEEKNENGQIITKFIETDHVYEYHKNMSSNAKSTLFSPKIPEEEQHTKIQHSLFIELLGTSAFRYNVTYDCSFKLAEKHKIAAGLGLQYTRDLCGLSPQINYLYGKKFHLELGIAYTHQIEPPSSYGRYYPLQIIPMRMGYRYQKENGGIFYKLALVYYLVCNYDTGEMPRFSWGSVALGYTF
jgi:hypothetical protein